jgi:hypothetical protein
MKISDKKKLIIAALIITKNFSDSPILKDIIEVRQQITNSISSADESTTAEATQNNREDYADWASYSDWSSYADWTSYADQA